MQFETRKDKELYMLQQELKAWRENYRALQEERFTACVECGSMFIRGTRIAPAKKGGYKHLRCPS